MFYSLYESKCTRLEFNLRNLNRSVFFYGFLSSKSHKNRFQSVFYTNRCIGIVFDCINKLSDLLSICSHITLQEEEHWFFTCNTISICNYCIGLAVVCVHYHTFGTKYFCSLIVSINSFSGVINNCDCSVSHLQCDHCSIYIACFSDSRINQNCRLYINFLCIASSQKTNHIKIMNGHIQEHTTGYCYILC